MLSWGGGLASGGRTVCERTDIVVVYKPWGKNLKICVMGNCQSAPIRDLLKKRIGVEADVVQLKPVHLLNKADLRDVLTHLRTADIVVTHLISENYNDLPIGTGQLKDIMRPGARLIVVPNAHFIGYFPSFLYIKDAKGRTVAPRIADYSCFPSDYHDAFCIAGKIKGLSMDQVSSFYAEYAGAHEWISKYVGESLESLRERERECDVTVSGYIEEFYTESQLFWTFNHPSNRLLEYIVDKVIECIGLAPIVQKNNAEYLKGTVLPLFPFVVNTMQMSFAPEKFAMDEVSNYEEFVSRCWAGYEKYPELLEVNRKSRRVAECLHMLR